MGSGPTGRYVKDKESGDWAQLEQTDFSYDPAGNVIGETRSRWDRDSEGWLMEVKAERSWNDKGNMTDEAKYWWHAENEKWNGIRRIQRSFNEEGDLLTNTDFQWDMDSEAWMKFEHFTRTYDGEGRLLEKLDHQWNPDTDTWVALFKEDHFWSGEEISTFLTGLNEHPSLLVYPNPATSHIYVEFPEGTGTASIDLLDAGGRLLRSSLHQGSGTVQLNCDDLSTGIYFLRLNADQVYMQKFMVR